MLGKIGLNAFVRKIRLIQTIKAIKREEVQHKRRPMIDGSGSYSYLAYCCPPRQLGMWGGRMGREIKEWRENEEKFVTQQEKGAHSSYCQV